MNARAGILLAALGAIFLGYVASGARSSPETSEAVAARVGRDVVSMATLDEVVADRTLVLRAELDAARRRALEELVNIRVLQRAAEARRQTVAELLEAELLRRTTPVTDRDALGYYAEHPAMFANMTQEEALASVRQMLRSGRRTWARRAFLKELRAREAIELMLPPPPRAHLRLDEGVDAIVDSEGSEVTVVLFFDMLDRKGIEAAASALILAESSPSVRLVLRELPSVENPRSWRLAEALSCAEAQGRQRDALQYFFDRHRSSPASADLHTMAATVGLDIAAFEACLPSPPTRSRIATAIDLAARLGMKGPAVLFINGRVILGQLHATEIRSAIEEEAASVRQAQ